LYYKYKIIILCIKNKKKRKTIIYDSGGLFGPCGPSGYYFYYYPLGFASIVMVIIIIDSDNDDDNKVQNKRERLEP
jgi:hypothetical protein